MKARKSGSHLIRLLVSALVASLITSGCAWFETDVNRAYAEHGRWPKDEPRVYTTADIRMVTHRRHPQTGQEVTCTEPTPDVAKALSTAGALTLKGGSNAGASGEVGLSGGSAEAVAELAGRSTALIALRDGLFRTCEAYVNGAIGSDAYALVLSRYGQLMTTLFLGEDIRGAAALSNTTAPTSPTLITVTPAAGSTTQIAGSNTQTPKASADGTGTKSPDTGAVTSGSGSGKKTSSTTNTAPGFLKVVNTVDASSTAGSASTSGSAQSAGNASQLSGANKSGSDPSSSTKTAASDTTGSIDTSSTPGNKPKTPSTPSDTSAPANNANTSPSAVAAVSLVRMNEDYFDLDVNFMHQLVVACINEFDPTRVRLRVSDPSVSSATELQMLLDAERARAQKFEENREQLDQEKQLLQRAEQLVGQMQQVQASQRQLEQQLTQLQSKNKSKSSTPSSAAGSATPASTDELPDMPVLLQNVVQGENPFLRQLCSSLANVKTLVAEERLLLPTFSAAGHPAASVHPDAGLSPPAAPPADDSQPKTPAPPKVKSRTPNINGAGSPHAQQSQSGVRESQSQPQSEIPSQSQQPSSPQQQPATTPQNSPGNT